MDLSTAIPVWDMAARLAAAAVCGAALGLDREIRGKAAGLRTHTLVAISAAVTTLVALELYWGMAGKGAGGGDMGPPRGLPGIPQAIGFISARG
ncbi:MgtC/SapB family protein, partial [Azospirillum brasilense]|uniref:MgtC/SapB family protein n=1 Tax=Azospirillum brasilense TaxID=192 RepID=UPI00157B498B